MVPPGLGLVEIYDADEATAPADVINISTRGRIGTAADILIAGFVIDGDRSKTVLVRGIGPTLADLGVAGYDHRSVSEDSTQTGRCRHRGSGDQRQLG